MFFEFSVKYCTAPSMKMCGKSTDSFQKAAAAGHVLYELWRHVAWYNEQALRVFRLNCIFLKCRDRACHANSFLISSLFSYWIFRQLKRATVAELCPEADDTQVPSYGFGQVGRIPESEQCRAVRLACSACIRSAKKILSSKQWPGLGTARALGTSILTLRRWTVPHVWTWVITWLFWTPIIRDVARQRQIRVRRLWSSPSSSPRSILSFAWWGWSAMYWLCMWL